MDFTFAHILPFRTAKEMEEKSVEDVCDWLEEKGFPEELLEVFRGKLEKFVTKCTVKDMY